MVIVNNLWHDHGSRLLAEVEGARGLDDRSSGEAKERVRHLNL